MNGKIKDASPVVVEGAVGKLVASIGHAVAGLAPTERAHVLVGASAAVGRLAMDAFDEVSGELATVLAFESAGGE